MFQQLQIINQRPEPFSVYTAEELWTDEYTAQQMLSYHLNDELALASRTREFIDRSVTWLQGRFDIDSDTRIADFGCGPGLYASRFARLGAQVTGIDFSANSIRYARESAERDKLKIDYRQQNYFDFACDQQFDLICMIMCDFCALSPEQRKQLLGIYRRHLKEGGRLVLDVYSLGSYEQRQEYAGYEFKQLNGFWSDKDYYGFLNTFKYDDVKVILDKYSLFEASGRVWTIYNWLQYYSPETLAREFAACGFRIQETYADLAGTRSRGETSEIAIVAERD